MQRYHLCPIWSRIHDQTRWCVLLGSLTSSGRSFTAAETEISATSSNKKSTSRKVRGNTSSSPIGKKYAPQKIPDSNSKIFNFQHHSDHSCWILVANFKALHFAEGIVVSRSQFDVYPSSFVRPGIPQCDARAGEAEFQCRKRLHKWHKSETCRSQRDGLLFWLNRIPNSQKKGYVEVSINAGTSSIIHF